MKRLVLPIIAFCVILLSFVGCIVSPVLGPDYDDENGAEGSVAIPGDTSPNSTSPTGSDSQGNYNVDDIVVTERGEFRAVWVATVLNLDFPVKTDLSAAAMKRHIDAIVANTVDMGLNAIIFQARPSGDAFYESDLFPWSQWLSGEQGVGIPDISGQEMFDPLAYWIEACHASGIELHAWLNPYRITHPNLNTPEISGLSSDNPVRQNPDLAVVWAASGNRKGLFLDPGLPEARQLIIDGISEILTKYDVDGIHFDDYFYPGTDFNDAASFETYGGEMELDDWRRGNVNVLIHNIQTVIREHNETTGKKVLWGISPTAIWKNGSEEEPLGIHGTSGQESYHAMYADTRRWVEEGWVDYICPQIYWYIGYGIADFEVVFNWWDDLCANSDVDFYVGHAAYRESENDQPPHWEGEIVRQLEIVDKSDTAKGSIFFRYGSLLSNIGASVRDFYTEKDGVPGREPIIIVDKLSIGFPAADASITGTPANSPGYNIVGTSIPDIPLYLNGQEVTSRTVEGFFHVFPPLAQGDNVFTFSQAGQEDVTRVITLKTPSVAPTSTPKPSVTDVTALDYATVTSNEAWVYSANSTSLSDGLGYMLTPGQVDRVVAKSGTSMVKLSSGIWLRTDTVTIERKNAAVTNPLKDGVYRAGSDYDMVVWESDIFAATVAAYDGSKLTVRFGMHSTAPELTLPDDLSETIFESARHGVSSNVPYWEFAIRDDAKFEGYYIDYENGEFRLLLKKRKSLAEGDLPLANITILLDAGHGGDAYGTTAGPLGNTLTEKALTLTNTLKLAERLETLGANVELTRDTDLDISLQERVNISRAVMPDIFISLHVNSNAEITNWINIRGFTVWHQNAVALPLTDTVQDVMQFINPGTNRAKVVNQSNFFVCRPWWSPHILFESSFISSIDDYVWLIDEKQQDRYADATVDMILEYFAK